MFAAEFEPAPAGMARRSQRARVSLDAKLGVGGPDVGSSDIGGLGRALCKVTDVSIHGARLQTYTALRKGSSIWLTLPRVGPVGADVMWADDFAAGCQFHAPLDPATLEALLARPA